MIGTMEADGVGATGVSDVVVGPGRRPLYRNSLDTAARIRCVGACARAWPPVLVPAGVTVPSKVAGVNGTFGVVRRPDRTRQLALDGRPLYRYAADRVDGSVGGNGSKVDFDGRKYTWWVVTTLGTVPSQTPTPTTTEESHYQGY
ncbi:COG4315 family predicted lipoprotein [Actinopolymorpha cephalotaxi]|uniref:Lipoprotein with Yx(FWY)xxD motif n=1 Tax=Actinopolymorpha cephalotaxi TaxID=504797 RepID=A0ABX2S4P6_9ACTN|nr:hypothetical protein [Actinopolymorpha cephalotaxi]NYH84575.1 putative lipoprotein with Yx(FWY)xxD motif [Actinopolymorpha cephalotaxi]